MDGVIEQGLRNLAIGATSSEVTKEYMEEDEDGKMIKVTKKTKKSNPNEKAMQILAKKYHKEIAADSDIVDTQSQVNININTSDMSLRTSKHSVTIRRYYRCKLYASHC